MVLTLIRATRKTTLNCMSALSVCLVPKVHCIQSQQLRTLCTCVTDYTHNLSDTHHRCKELLEQNGFSVAQSLVLCVRNAFDIIIRQPIKRYYRLQQLELHFILQMEWCITHHIRAQCIETSLQWTPNEIFNLLRCKVEVVLEAVSGFTNLFSSSFEDNEPVLFVFWCSC